jgi:hypothetical protein
MHETAHYVAAHRVKVWIERWSGLSLSDAVNVAVFILTIVSLVLAAAGVVVAVLTLKDAHDSGVQQTRSLESERAALLGVQKGITDQEAILSGNLEAAKKEEEALTENVNIAREQLKALNAQDVRLSESPRVQASMRCLGDGDDVEYDDPPPRGQQWTGDLRVNSSGSITCAFEIKNFGTAPLNAAYLRVGVHGFSFPDTDHAIALSYTTMLGHSQVEFGMEPESGNTAKWVDLIKDAQIFPHADDEPVTWTLSIPDGVTTVQFEFEYGGSNYAEHDYGYVIDVVRK